MKGTDDAKKIIEESPYRVELDASLEKISELLENKRLNQLIYNGRS